MGVLALVYSEHCKLAHGGNLHVVFKLGKTHIN